MVSIKLRQGAAEHPKERDQNMYEYDIPLTYISLTEPTFWNMIFENKETIELKVTKKLEILSILAEYSWFVLQPTCTEFSRKCIANIMGNLSPATKDLRFVYYICPHKGWQGSLILQGRVRYTYVDLFSVKTEKIAKLDQCLATVSNPAGIQAYAFCSLMTMFREYYKAKGRFYPAYIRLANDS